jgi:hypothetical protein
MCGKVRGIVAPSWKRHNPDLSCLRSGQRQACHIGPSLALQIGRLAVLPASRSRPGALYRRRGLAQLRRSCRQIQRRHGRHTRPGQVADGIQHFPEINARASAAAADGRRFRILAVVDDFSRECLALVADTSLSGVPVARRTGYGDGASRPPLGVCQRQRHRTDQQRHPEMEPGSAGGVALHRPLAGRSRTPLWKASTAACVTSA